MTIRRLIVLALAVLAAGAPPVTAVDRPAAVPAASDADARRAAAQGIERFITSGISDERRRDQLADPAVKALLEMGGPGQQAIIRLLEREDGQLQRTVLSVLSHSKADRTFAVPAVLRLCSAKDGEVRGGAFWTLRMVAPHSPEAIRVLVEGLDDREEGIRRSSVLAVREIGPPAKAAVPGLVRRLGDPREDEFVRRDAAEALGRIGPPARDALPALKKIVDAGENAELAGDAVLAIAQMETDPDKACSGLVDAAFRRDWSVRRKAVRALGRYGREGAAAVLFLADEHFTGAEEEALEAALEAGRDGIARFADRLMPLLSPEKPARVRLRAARLLVEVQPNSPAVLAAARAGAGDPSPWERRRAAAVLGRVAPADVPVQALVSMLGDEDEEVRFAAVTALQNQGGSARPAVAALMKTVLQDRSVKVRNAAMDAVSRIGAPELVLLLEKEEDFPREELAIIVGSIFAKSADAATAETAARWLSWLDGGDRYRRLAALQAVFVSGRKDERIAAAVIRALDDPRAAVRCTALRALGRMGALARPAVPKLIERLKNGPAFERSVAARAVAHLGAPARDAAPALVGAFAVKDEDLRAAILEAAQALGPHAASAAPALLAGLRSKDPDTFYPTLGLVRQFGPGAAPVVPEMLKLLGENRQHSSYTDSRSFVGMRLADGVGNAGPAAVGAAPELLRLLQDNETAPIVAVHILEAVGKVCRPPAGEGAGTRTATVAPPR
jgi:HEAT repeat protein